MFSSPDGLLSAVQKDILRWIIHSGSGFNLISEKSVTKEDRKMVTLTKTPCRMATVNGITVAEEQLSIRVDGLGEDVDAIILDNSPCNILSLGKLCMERGFGFDWKPGEPPRLIMPDGSVRVLLVEQYVPIIASAALPAKRVTEQENMNVDEASEMSLPHPGGDDLITHHADLGKIKKEHNGGITVGVPKESAETRWKGNCCMLNIAACAKATSSNDNKPFLVKHAFPKKPLDIPRERRTS